MANKNFVVHNGLTVGPYVVFAGNGDIVTSGNITTTGAGAISSANGFTGLDTNQIYSGTSNVTVSPTTVTIGLGGASNVATFSASAVVIDGNLTVNGVTTSINATNLDIEDLNITIAKGAINAAAANGAGLTVDGANATITYNNSPDGWTFNKSISTTQVTAATLNSTSGNITTLSAGTINVSTAIDLADNDILRFGTGDDWELYHNGTGNFMDLNVGDLIIRDNVTNRITIQRTTGHIIPAGNTTQNLGSPTAWWGTFYGVSTQAQYADLAENYMADQSYPPGTVLEFGGHAEVTLARTENTTKVAGVVSTNPAHVMNGQLKGTNVATVALQGRVPCQVIGPVKKGDMMVSAGHGYAKANPDPKLGSVIGKALQDFSGDKGVIEVVVGRM